MTDTALSTASPARELSPDRRGQLIALCMTLGFGVPACCWLAVLLGATREIFMHDQVAVWGVMLSIYAPLLAFLNNPGEKRTLEQQLLHFAFLVFFSNVGYQLFWEMPWFLIKETIYASPVTEADAWLWPWWAYGVADTRYLKPNELSISISGMDASVALLEVFIVMMYFRGYRILAAWFALIMGSCMGWGQYYFYMGEIYFGFANIEDGWFGFWIKYMIMNLAWLIFPFVAGAGFIWNLTTHYKNLGVREYLRSGPDTMRNDSSDFYRGTHMLQRSNDAFDYLDDSVDMRAMKRIITIAFASPLAFLALDMWRFFT